MNVLDDPLLIDGCWISLVAGGLRAVLVVATVVLGLQPRPAVH